ncbi:MAG TPA: DNA topoisomerase, partial [Bacteroidales bacterium]
RPAYFDQETVQGSAAEKKLYSLIYKRTLASQMSDALFERTTVSIKVEGLPYHFVATGEVLKFDGFLKMYIESNDEESESDNLKILPPLTKNQPLNVKNITSTERFTHHPPRYTEASLVRKLEELGIGRPSTYAPIISTIQQREYVVKTDRDGSERNFDVLKLENKNITELTEKETFNVEKAKLFPTDIGILVTDYLVDHFKDIMDYNFTANVEKDFDEIAEGKMLWTKMLDAFYGPFHKKVEMAIATRENTKGDRLIGNDPVSGKPIIARIGRFGPMVQIGQSDDEEKPRYAKLQPGQYIETITLEQALNLFQLPKKLGSYENYEVSVGIGRFGPYILHHAKYYSLVKGVDDPYNITLQRAIELINDKREKDKNKVINSFEYQKSEIQVLNGRFGPYICYNKENYKIPKNTDATKLTAEQCIDIIQKGASTTKTKKKRKK